MQIRGLVGLCYYRSEIKSPAMKTQDKINNKGKLWQDDKRREVEGDCLIIYPGREARATSNGMEC